jgi:hypothetical protein
VSVVFGVGFVLLGVVGLILQLTSPRKAPDLLEWLVATRAGRILTVLVWGWLGWHFLAR